MPDGSRPAVPANAPLVLVTLGGAALRVVDVPNDTPGSSRPATPQPRLFDLGKPLAVITYIACAPDRSVPREHLTDLLWGDVEPEAAKHALRQTLWYIRKRLGDRVLIGGGDRLSVVGALEVDRDRFLAAVAASDAEAVVRLYTGEFFPGFAAPGGAEFERWADIERQRLRSFFWRSAEYLVRHWLSSGRLRDAQTLARQVRDGDRLRESGWRLLLETIIASGDAVTAAIEADAFDRLARAEGIEPEPATRSLLRVARQTPGPESERLPEQPSSLFAELVGREQEFAQLLASWESARAGKATHVHVLASAGLGKTRLLTDVNARLRATRARTLFVRASLGARDIPFALASDLAEALAQLPGASGISTGSARTLVALNPALSALYPAALPDATGDLADATRRCAVAIRELISVIVEEQPVAIFIDDMQWADTRSRQVVGSVVGALERSRVLVVTASRPTVDAFTPAESSLTIRLEPLDTAAVGALLASIAALPSEMWAERLPEELCDATSGSPLLTLETIRLAIEGGLLVRGETWSAPHTARLFAALGTGGALRQRVEHLGRVERWVMTLLAVAGVPLAREAITAAAGRSDDEIATALGDLERRGLAARQGELWSTSHDEIAAMTVELAAPDARRAAARSLARMLLDSHSAGTRVLRQAGALLADAGDNAVAGAAFLRFARLARDAGDRQSNRGLAEDFLGARSTPDRVTQLVRALPLVHRAGFYSTKRQVAAIGALAMIPLAVHLNALIGRQPPPDIVLAVGAVGLDSTARLYRVPVRSAQLGGSAIIDAGSGRPTWRLHADPSTGELRRHPGRNAWTLERIASDSGGIDLFEAADGGPEQRLTAAVGDDQSPAWSPDGRLLVFFTARWNAESHYDLAVLDTRTNEVRPLTSGPETDAAPAWSADGSRIAFSRRYWDGRAPEACVIDVDGGNLRCFPSKPGGMTPLSAWYDVNHVVVEVGLGWQQRFVGRLDVSSGSVDTLFTLRAGDVATVSEDGRWVLCRCRRLGFPANALLLFGLDEPNRVVEIDMRRFNGARPLVSFESTMPNGQYAERVAIENGLGTPVVGVPHLLTAQGLTPGGDTTALGAVRWTSLDTSVAVIDSTGLMMPKREGRVRVIASAGGWRTSSRDLTILAPATATVMNEDWSSELEPGWRPFGSPKPRIVRAPEGFEALLNNGDGSFQSGVYSTARYATSRGLALDTRVSARVTMDQWQVVTISVDDAMADAGLKAWDHTNGPVPRRRADWPECHVSYPATEGAGYGDTLQVAVGGPGQPHGIVAPRSFRAGAWFDVRLQIFPDGRCGVAINGVPVGLSRSPALRDSAVRVVIAGNSVRTLVLVGPVRLRTGVPMDIDWSRSGQAVPNALR